MIDASFRRGFELLQAHYNFVIPMALQILKPPQQPFQIWPHKFLSKGFKVIGIDVDKKKIEAIEARNNADSIVHSTEKSLKEYGDKISKEDKEKIENSLDSLKETLKNDKSEPSELKEKTDALVQDSMKLGEVIYKEAQEKAEKEKADQEKSKGSGKDSPKKNAKTSKSKKDEKVVDADFEDVTDKKGSDDDGKEKSA